MAETDPELGILEAIERNPDITQANLAIQLDVAVGKINWYLKRLVNKGYVKVTHLQRRKLHYFLTPSGLALKLELTRSYMDVSLRVYRELREAARAILHQVREAGYSAVYIDGHDEATEILRLTCLEEGVKFDLDGVGAPLLRPNGVGFVAIWPLDSDDQKGMTTSEMSPL
jgi:DNA-binding MarR family transcriptional regulator